MIRTIVALCCLLGTFLVIAAHAGPAMTVYTATFPPSNAQAVCIAGARIALNESGFELADAGDGPTVFGRNINYTASVTCNSRAGFAVIAVAGRDMDEAHHYAGWIQDKILGR